MAPRGIIFSHVKTTTETVAPHTIRALHAPTLAAHLAAIAASLADGWSGRPRLAYRVEGGDVIALTGSHRLAAARALELDGVPVLILDLDATETYEDEYGDTVTLYEAIAERHLDDDNRLAVLTAACAPAEVVALMAAEIAANEAA